MQQPTQKQIRFILECALLAPSADNHHRVRFEVVEDTIHVRHVDGQLPFAGGYKRILVLLSLGALVESLAIAATRFGLAADTTLLPDPERPEIVLRIRLRSHGTEPDPLWSSIPLRHTSRHLVFRGPAMSDAQHAELAAVVHACPGSELVWLDEVRRRKQALRLMWRAETERFRNRLLHEELFSAIRFDVGWHSSCSEGLPPGSLGVEAPLRPFFALLRHWPIARLANMFGMHLLLGFRSCYLPCRLAPHLGLVVVRSPDSQSVLDAGRSFLRLWLAVTDQGRVLQPMPASALYAWAVGGAEGIPADLQQTLAQGWRGILGEGIPVMLFRMGFASQSPIVTGRPQLNEYLEQA